MKKTYEDYLNDPRIKNEPMGLRITHAMRFVVQDETKDMTAEERTAYYHEGTRAFLAEFGISPIYASSYHGENA